MSEVLIVGGGVIGLSLAYELAGHDLRMRVIDAGQPGAKRRGPGPEFCHPPRPPTTIRASGWPR